MYKLEIYEKELKATIMGSNLFSIIMSHADEVTRLINHNREVIVTWKRNKGPAFFSQFMASGFHKQAVIKKEMDGISLVSLIRRMAVVLQDYGSTGLVAVIDQYFLLVLDYAVNAHSLHQIFEKLRLYDEYY